MSGTHRIEDMRETLRRAVENLPTPVKTRALNAFDGFDRARRLLAIDLEMASFRAITAEEEAVTALFRALKYRKYPGAEKLDMYSHVMKAAVYPFTVAVALAMVGENGSQKFHLTLDWKKPEIVIQIRLEDLGVVFPGSEGLALQPTQPLGLLGGRGGANPAEFYDRAIQKVAAQANVENILAFVRNAANARNTLLYASDSSVPASKVTANAIDARQRNANTALLLAIAVMQTKDHQPMAVQCLAAFLKMVGKVLEHPDLSHLLKPPEVIIKPATTPAGGGTVES